MNKYNAGPTPLHGAKDDETETSASGERRRLSRIRHDERGMAYVEWIDAPSDYQRPVLSIEDEPGVQPRDTVRGRRLELSIQNEDSFNPYDRRPDPAAGNGAPRSARRDLRKLSEWMKMMRRLEEQKKNGEE
ncbi:MAG: hypothetical protein IRZ28_07470 [Steroidobacteraceae bacterium]|nr:hypothetical protein [Steroidobacteraceae bacterium]